MPVASNGRCHSAQTTVTPSCIRGTCLRQDKHYFTRDEYDTEGENGPSKRAFRARQMLSRRKDHFLHAFAKHIVEECIDHEDGRIAIGDMSQSREDENDHSRNWGKCGNKKRAGEHSQKNNSEPSDGGYE